MSERVRDWLVAPALHRPSPRSVLASLLVPLAAFAVVWAIEDRFQFDSGSTPTVGNAAHLEVQGLIFAAVFGVVLFVVGLSGPSVTEGFRRAEVVLKQTLLFPFILANGLAIALTLVRPSPAWVWAVTLATLLMGGFIVYKLLDSFLVPGRIRQLGIRLFQDRIKAEARQLAAIDARRAEIKRNLAALSDHAVAVSVSPFVVERWGGESQFAVHADRPGHVRDLELGFVTLAVDRLREETTTWQAREASILKDDSGFMRDPQPRAQIILHFLPGQHLLPYEQPNEFRLATVIAEQPLSDSLRQNLTTLLQAAHRLDPGVRTDEVRSTLNVVFDDARLALASDRPRHVEEALGLYRDLCGSYLIEVEAPEDEGSPDYGRAVDAVIEWLRADMQELIADIFKDGSVSLGREAAYTPIRVCLLAMNHRQVHVFRSFFQLVTWQYKLIMNNSRHADGSIVKALSAYLSAVALHAGRGDKPETLPAPYIRSAFISWNELLRLALDSRNVDDFELFAKAIDDFEKHSPDSDAGDRRNYPQVVRLGFSAWLVDRVRGAGEPVNEIDRPLLELIERGALQLAAGLPQDVGSLIAIFVEAISLEHEDVFPWGWWSKEDVLADGGVATISFDAQLATLTSLRALDLIARSGGAPTTITPKPTSTWHYLLSDHGPLHRALNNLEQQGLEAWDWFAPRANLEDVPKLRSLLQDGLKRQQELEEELAIQRPISASLCTHFVNEIRHFAVSGVLRREFLQCESYSQETPSADDKLPESFGFKRLVDRAAFLDTWEVEYPDLGRDYGRSLARSEDSEVHAQLVELSATLRPLIRTEPSKVIGTIRRAVGELCDSGRAPTHILAPYESLKPIYTRLLQELEIPSEGEEPTKYSGYLRVGDMRVPLYTIWNARLPERILVADLHSLAKWVQWLEPDGEIYRASVVDLVENDGERDMIISGKPDYLEGMNPDEQVRYLQLRVVISALQRFEIRPGDLEACKVIEVTSPDS